jgi:hypothetical protein
MEYSERISNFKQFIRLKYFVLKYNEMIKISKEFLYEKKEINIWLFILFEKLEVYLDKEYGADKANYNGIFAKHP